MPPLPSVPADRDRLSKLPTSTPDGYTMLSKLCLLAMVVVTGLRLAIIKHLSRKRRSSAPGPTIHAPEKVPISRQGASEKHLRHAPLFGGQAEPYTTLYPWILPPQPLPGPYDPRLYPLPTLRRHSYDPSTNVSTERSEIAYIRRVSLNSIPTQQSTIRGTVTTSSKGWRRNQWIISGE
ncbi:hypothetical protein BU23DRAFT_199028 [Bimuria novae-zelandiae CBS 107.79]|uniref:Uncharacterized protein n=1 Tax=Bimuria novae-zelandiae CBS 107.79 TaxID=1447943 RepID=A0A6A5V7Q5_9PLEO|nr:hypothetical protein BU23DRAFT_199028 [Bimuria novae-zelandiae CBS 107.79]